MVKNIVLKTEELLPSLSSVVSVVNAKNTMPALGYVLLYVRKKPNEDNTVNMALLASDGDLWLKREVKVEEGSELGLNICVDAKTFLQTMNALQGQLVTLEFDDEQHTLNCKYLNGRIAIPTFDTKEYPMPIKVNEESKHVQTVKSNEFLHAIDKVGYAIANDMLNPILNGVNVDFSDSRMTTTATDKRMFSTYTSTCEASDQSSFPLPTKPHKMLVSCMSDFGEEETTISYDEKIVVFQHEDFVLTTRLLEGNYPQLKKYIPTNYQKAARFNKQAMIDALKRVGVASNSSNLCVISFDGCTCTVMCEDVDYSKNGSESVVCEYYGEPFSICLSQQLLQQTIQAIEAEDIKMMFDEPMKPALFYDESIPSENEYVAMIMPMKRI